MSAVLNKHHWIIVKLDSWLVHDKSWSSTVFAGDPDTFMDSGSLSRIRYH